MKKHHERQNASAKRDRDETQCMKIGITYDLKSEAPTSPDLPDDHQEEFDSPHTIDAIAAVLRGLGHQVQLLGDGREFLEKVLRDPPDFVFNFAEGTGASRSREARVPAVLEMLGIPYTGSDPLTMAVTLDKEFARRVVLAAHVGVPQGWCVLPDESPPFRPPAALRIKPPLVVKPAWEGSSKGIRNKCLVKDWRDLTAIVEELRRDHRQPVLIEEFIAGPEVTVGVYGNDPPQILGVMGIVPKQAMDHFIYSLEVKRDFRNMVKYECPAGLSPLLLEWVETMALSAFKALGCRDFARIDFRIDLRPRHGQPCFLEINPLPGLNPDDSDLVIMAGLVGWSYPKLIETILNAALKRHNMR